MSLTEIPCPHCNNFDKATIPGEVVNTFEETGSGLVKSSVKFIKSNMHTEVECSHCEQTYTVEYER